MNDRILNKIIKTAYGDAGILDSIRVYFIIKNNEDARRIYEEYKNTANQIKKIEPDICPEEIIFNIPNTSNHKYKKSLFKDVYTLYLRKPIVSTATAFIVVIAIVFSMLIKRPEIENTYTNQELVLANEQVKQTLAIIGNVFNKTQQTIEKEILATRVGKPLRKGIKVVNDLLIEGDKNENNN